MYSFVIVVDAIRRWRETLEKRNHSSVSSTLSASCPSFGAGQSEETVRVKYTIGKYDVGIKLCSLFLGVFGIDQPVHCRYKFSSPCS